MKLVPFLAMILFGFPLGGSDRVSAQPDSEFHRGERATSPVKQTPLEDEALQFAQAWVNSDGPELEAMMADQEIRLHLQGEVHLSIPPRQARASVQSFLERFSGGEAEVFRVSLTGGDSSRGFTEIRWRTTVSGTTEAVIFTLFVAFSLEENVWLVSEIRVLS